MFAPLRLSIRCCSITSVASVLLAAGTLVPAMGTNVSHAADGEPAATGRSAAHSGEWTVTIAPAGRRSLAEVAVADGPIIIPAAPTAPDAPLLLEVPAEPGQAEMTARLVPAGFRTYREAYRAVPFSRAEYLANPSYRHDAAMELLFGTMRPTVIHRHVAQPRPAQAVAVFSPYLASPYAYDPLIYRRPGYDYSRGPYSRYPGLFGWRGGYRPLFYLPQ